MRYTIFKTERGSAYVIDHEANTLQRYSGDGNQLKGDGNPLFIRYMSTIAIGKGTVFVLSIRKDGIPTQRVTSVVTDIKYRGTDAS